MIFTIPNSVYGVFKASFGRIQKAAIKCGSPVPTETILARRVVERENAFGYTFDLAVLDIEVIGAAPRLEGDFTVVAALDNFGEENLVRSLPGSEVDERFRATGTICEHCNSARARKHLYVIEDGSGKQLQVGKSCLKDFVGHASPATIAAYWTQLENLFRDIDDEFVGGDKFEYVDAHTLLTTTIAAIRAFGWKSRSKAQMGEQTTADVVGIVLNTRLDSPDAVLLRREVNNVRREEDAAKAKEVLAWVADLKTNSEYNHNLKLSLQEGLVSQRHFGIACSAIVSHQGFQQRCEQTVSKAVGEVGEKLTGLKVKVTFHRELAGEYGVTQLIKFTTEEGNVLVWFGSGSSARDIAELIGEEVVIKGTVKAHKPGFKDGIETQLTRVSEVKL